jgi:multiple sugar transport system substrate-binding protein
MSIFTRQVKASHSASHFVDSCRSGGSQQVQARLSGWRHACQIAIAFWCSGLLILAGCSSQKEAQEEARPFQDVTIRVSVPRGWQFPNSWDVHLEEWSVRTGAKVELTEQDTSDLTRPLLPPTEPPHLILFPWSRRGELLAARQLQPFPPSALEESQLNWSDYLQGLREKQASTEGGGFLIPISSPILTCYYRADLLEKAGLKPPESWQDYQKLLDQLGDWAPGLTAAEPWSPEFRATMFLARAVSVVKSPGQLTVFFDVDDGKPYIAAPGFVKSLEQVQAAVAKMPPEVLTYDPITCRNLVVAGKAALAIGLENGPLHLPLALNAASPRQEANPAELTRAEKISIGISRLPGAEQVYNSTFETWESYAPTASHVSYTGFAGLCAGIPRLGTADKPVQTEAALNLLASLLHEADSTFPAGSRSLVRESDVTNAGAWGGTELTAEEAGSYMASVARGLRDRQQVSELPVVGHAQFRDALTKGLTATLENNVPPSESLKQVSAAWQEIMQKVGRDEVLKSYRRALGLSERQQL